MLCENVFFISGWKAGSDQERIREYA